MTYYDDSTVEATLRTYVQKTTNAHFIFSGSQRHLMDGMFTYIGANQDAIFETGKIGISNAMNYDANVDGLKKMYQNESNSRRQYYERRRSASSQEEKRQAGRKRVF